MFNREDLESMPVEEEVKYPKNKIIDKSIIEPNNSMYPNYVKPNDPIDIEKL